MKQVKAMIEIKNVTKSYEKKVAIEGINLTINDSSVLGIAGFNGSGKTTLLNICAGIYKPDSGEVLLDGAVAFDNDVERKQMFFLADEFFFPAGATVKSTARFYSSYHPNFDFELFKNICDIFGLKEKATIRSLSKGMKKQASLAVAFASKPKYLLIDETFDGLDPHKKELLKNILLEYINETSASVIIASHDLTEIAGVCDRVAILNGKNVILDSNIDDISDHYRKVALTFEMPVTEQTFKGINYRNLKLSGRNVYMTIFGDIDKETQKLKDLGATITDSTRLTLEEVFIEETEAENENEKIKSLFKK